MMRGYQHATALFLILFANSVAAVDFPIESRRCPDRDFTTSAFSPSTKIDPYQPVMFFLHDARRDKPDLVELTASPTLFLDVTNANLMSILRLEAYFATDETFNKLCSDEIRRVGPHWYTLQAPGVTKTSVVRWRIALFDSENGGPTGDPPYAPRIDIYDPQREISRKAFVTPPVRPTYRDTVDGMRGADYTQPCVSSDGPVRERASLQSIGLQDRVPKAGIESIYLKAGRRLYVEFVPASSADNDLPYPNVRGEMYAKEGVDGSFVPICVFQLEKAPDARFVVGIAPWDEVEKLVWRLDISKNDEVPSKMLGINAARELGSQDTDDMDTTQIERVCLDSTDIPNLNLARKQQSVKPAQTATPFGSQKFFKLAIQKDGKQPDSMSFDRASRAAIAAFSVWRHVCTACSDYNFSAIQFGAQTLMLTSLYSSLRIKAKVVLPPLGRSADDTNLTFPDTRIGMAGISSPVYNWIDTDEAAIKYLCAADSSKFEEWMIELRNGPICNATLNLAYQPLTLNFKNGSTVCGSDTNIVACEVDDYLIEFDALHYTFRDAGTSTGIGVGPREVSLQGVMLHEIGHWVGLSGHTTSREGIMGQYYSQDHCVDSAALRGLVNATQSGAPTSGPHKPATLLYAR